MTHFAKSSNVGHKFSGVTSKKNITTSSNPAPSSNLSGTRTITGTATSQATSSPSFISASNIFDNILSGRGLPQTSAEMQTSTNIQTLGQNQLNIVESVKNAFSTILKPNTQTASINNTVTKGTSIADNPDKTNSLGDSIKQGFSDIFAQIGPGGVVIGALVIGVLLLKK